MNAQTPSAVLPLHKAVHHRSSPPRLRADAVLLIAVFSAGMLIASAGRCVGEDSSDLQEPRRNATVALTRAAHEREASLSTLAALADAQLRAGQIDQAIENFEAIIAAAPQREPYLWQYGIALYFAGRHADGKDLFEKHRLVNPNDVENAAWHFLCVAKAEGLQAAQRLVLPAPGDRRVPMKQVLERLRLPDNSPRDFESILAAAESTRDTRIDPSAKLYADLYIGMIADAEGDLTTARKYIAAAAQTELTHYMADVARVYHESLR